MAEILGDAQGSAVMAALRVTVSCPGRGERVSGATQSRDPDRVELGDAWAPAQQCGTARRTASGAREQSARGSYISSRPSSNGSAPPARFFLFERCQTTPGKPFSGTRGSPV